ncbi:hypothetical protein EJA70_20525 [Pseudomonas sp. PB103]|nr:hypothetical protein EJA70_20525 [Pseudomonas sp. PB103]
MSIDPPHSRAGSLPQVSSVNTRCVNDREPCGSWLASDDGGSVDILGTDKPPSLASQLPQGSLVFVGVEHRVDIPASGQTPTRGL